MVVLASTKNSSRNAGGKRKEHDAADDLPLLAVKSIAALLHLCPNACSLQKVMASLPPAVASGSTSGMEHDISGTPVLKDSCRPVMQHQEKTIVHCGRHIEDSKYMCCGVLR